MKYSLRSLMVGITLVAIVTGAVVAWREHRMICLERAAYHRSNIVKPSDMITTFRNLSGMDEGFDSQFADLLAQFEAEDKKQQGFDSQLADLLAQIEAEDKKQRRENASHEAKSSAYQLAVWRPWERLWIDDPVTSQEIRKYFKAKELARQELNEIAGETQKRSQNHSQADSELFRKLADEAREKYGVP